MTNVRITPKGVILGTMMKNLSDRVTYEDLEHTTNMIMEKLFDFSEKALEKMDKVKCPLEFTGPFLFWINAKCLEWPDKAYVVPKDANPKDYIGHPMVIALKAEEIDED